MPFMSLWICMMLNGIQTLIGSFAGSPCLSWCPMSAMNQAIAHGSSIVGLCGPPPQLPEVISGIVLGLQLMRLFQHGLLAGHFVQKWNLRELTSSVAGDVMWFLRAVNSDFLNDIMSGSLSVAIWSMEQLIKCTKWLRCWACIMLPTNWTYACCQRVSQETFVVWKPRMLLG